MQFLTPIQRYFLGCSLAFVLGAWCMDLAHKKHNGRPVPEPPAADVIQADGSRILERNPPKQTPKLPSIPSGHVVTRITTAQIQLEPSPEPRAVTVQLTQIQDPQGSRVIASTESGQVIGGSDWTAPPPAPPRTYRWEVQAIRAWTPRGSAWGAAIGYTRGPLVASAAVVPGPVSMVQAGIGFRW